MSNLLVAARARKARNNAKVKSIRTKRHKQPTNHRGYIQQRANIGRLRTCEGEVIVQGDEGPVCGVAQVVDCHEVTVSHQEREEEEEQQEVEGDKEEEHSKNAAHGWHADETTTQVRAALSHVV